VASREQHAERLVAAMRGLETAKVERDAAVTAALKGNLSVRDVAKLSGLSTTTVQKIGHANGWPTAAQRRQWEAEKNRRAEFYERYGLDYQPRDPRSH
jgi:hypothetical protein